MVKSHTGTHHRWTAKQWLYVHLALPSLLNHKQRRHSLHHHSHSRSTCTHNSHVCWELPYHHLVPTTLSTPHCTQQNLMPPACASAIPCSSQLNDSPFQMRAILSLLVLFCHEEHLLLELSSHQRQCERAGSCAVHSRDQSTQGRGWRVSAFLWSPPPAPHVA